MFSGLFSGVKDFYNGINPATLSGAIDVIVVRQPDGTLKCTPFHVRFGKISLWRIKETVVDIHINDERVDLKMKIGPAGEAFFVTPVEDGAQSAADLATSPLPEAQSPTPLSPAPISGASGAPANANVLAAAAATAAVPATPASAAVPALSAATSRSMSVTSPDSSDCELYGIDPAQPRRLSHLNPNGPSSGGGGGGANAAATVARQAAVRAMTPTSLCRALESLGEAPLVADHAHPLATPMLQLQLLAALDNATNHPAALALALAPSTASAAASAASAPPSDQPQAILGWQWGSLPVRHASGVAGPGPGPAPAANLVANSTIVNGNATEKDDVAHALQERVAALVSAAAKVNSGCPAAAEKSVSTPAAATNDTSSDELFSDAEDGGLLGDTTLTPIPFESSAQATPAVESRPPPPVADDDRREACLALSLCGLLDPTLDIKARESQFLAQQVSWPVFAADPLAVLSNSALTARLGDQYLPWHVASASLAAMTAFGQALPEATMQKLTSKKEAARGGWGGWFFRRSTGDSPSTTTTVTTTTTTTTTTTSMNGAGHPSVPIPIPISVPASSGAGGMADPARPARTASPPLASSGEWSAIGDDQPAARATVAKNGKTFTAHRCAKTLYLTGAQLAGLGLRDGMNRADFSFASKLQGKTVVSCSIYLWDHTDKIVVSDIDGTITKSDVMGHAAALLGRDWTHLGVAKLFTSIADNGYRFLYLSSRSISHAYATRGYLKGVRQEQSATLPDGPVLLSPESFMNSIHREVIARAAEQFKIPCLLSVLELFPADIDGNTGGPFVAGFGNRPTDVLTYNAVKIPEDRIFTIDPKGNLKLNSTARKSSYRELGSLVDHYFAPIRVQQGVAVAPAVSREFTSVNFWAPSPYGNVDIGDLEKLLKK